MPFFQPISRRTMLRGAGVCMAIPVLDAMLPRRGAAQAATPQRFIGFFYPNGTDPRKWNPPAGALNGMSLPECLQDLNGFAAEGIWPAETATFQDVTVVTGVDHSGVCVDIHMPSMSLCAHRGTSNTYVPPMPTLDQALAERLKANRPFRNLALSATPSTDIGQGYISFRANGQTESVVRDPKQLWNTLFGKAMTPAMTAAAAAPVDPARRTARQASVLNLVLEDAKRLQARVGAGDRLRLEQYFDAVNELEQQVNAAPPPATSSCATPQMPMGGGNNWHAKSKLFIDLAVLAMACDLTRVITIQYSDSWGVNYTDYKIGTGIEALGTWSDHFISHKLDDNDRATDLDGLQRSEAQRIADIRVVQTSRFKVRRFSYLVNSLKRVTTPTGTLLDESLVMYHSENGDGDSHARKNMPIMLAGHVGGFQTGRAVAATNQPTGALHASILKRFGFDVGTYGNPGGTAIAAL